MVSVAGAGQCGGSVMPSRSSSERILGLGRTDYHLAAPCLDLHRGTAGKSRRLHDVPRQPNGHVGAQQGHAAQPLGHHLIKDKRVGRPVAAYAQIIEDLDPAPQDALSIELDRLLLLLQVFHNVGKLTSSDQNIDILDWTTVAVEVCGHAGTHAPDQPVLVQHALDDPEISCNE